MKLKRIIAALLAAAITVSSIAPEAFAEISGAGGTSTVNVSADPASGGSDKAEESGKTVLSSEPGEGESDYTYNALDDGTIEITGYSGSAENIVIPAQIDGKSVTRIGNNAFEKSSAKEIVIPDSVTEIGSQAFSGCGKLTGVSIPNSVTTIRDRAFFDCNSLASITIPDSVTDIELQAFCNCTSLKSVTIPASVTDIGDEAFGYYFNDIDESEIKKVDGFKINYVKNTYGHYYATKNGFSDEDCLFTNELNDGTLEISKYVGNSATYEIPGEIDGKKVIRIGNSAFIDCTELTSVTIPDGVTDIRWRAFYNCVSLKSVTIPKSVTHIDNYAFGYYDDSDSFETKKIDGFKINYVKNTYGHMYALKNGFTDEACLLTHELGNGTLEITEYVGNSATYVIPSEIDGKKVTQIGYDAFNDCTELTSITIPDGVTCIGNSSFSDCTSLEMVTIPNSVTQIYSRAFYNCTSLKEVTIPASVTDIGDEAFGYYYDRDSWKEKKVDGFKINYVNNTRGHWYAIKNGFTDGDCFVVNELDDGTVEITGYAGNSATCVIPDEIHGKKVTRISDSAFIYRTELTSVTIPDSVKYIFDRAFSNCTSLETVTIPNSVTDIYSSAFYNCTSLKEVTIPASVTDIGDEAFGYYSDIDGSEIKKVDGFKINYVKNTYGHYYATKNGFSDEDCLLTNELDDGTLEISNYAGNSATYEIPGEIDGKKVVRIGDYAFSDCTELTSVTIPDSVTDIRWRAFYNCVSLKSVTIPKSVTHIDNYAFGYYDDSDSFETKKIDGFKINYVKNTYGHMYALKNGFTDEACFLTNELDDGTLEISNYAGNSATCVIPSEIDGKKVTQIGYNAFNGCTELTSITIPDGVTHIYPRAFYNCTSLKEVAIPASATSIGNEAFGYYYDRDSSETKKADGFKINYVNNTQGHWYAIKNGFTDGACFVVNELDDGTVGITGYAGNSATCVIPDEIHGKKVTRISDSAFIYRTELTSVTIPDSVKYIFDRAFSNCTSLETVTIPNSVTDIYSSAFYNCTSLKEVTIPASVTDIGDKAFGYYRYEDTWELKKVDGFKINYVKNTYGHYYATENGFTDEACLLTNELNDGTLKISQYVGNSATSATYVIPGEINGKKVTQIGNSAFTVCTSLTSVTIPDGVTSIDEAAFWGCTSLTSVTIPDSVTSIKSKAFFKCTSLKSVTIPASVTNIGDYALGYYEIYNTDSCEWEMYKVDGFKINYVKDTYGHMYALKNGFTDEACLLTNELDDGTLEITKYVGNSATYVIPGEIDGKKVTKIGDSAFKGCTELTSITIPDGVTDIGNNAFSGCTSLETVTIPASVTYVGNSAFYGCTSLKSVTIPESVTYIGGYAFAECYSLKYADIPANVSGIGASPFYNCRSLENINTDEANKWYTTVDGVLYDKDKTELINYPAGKKDSSYVIPEGIRTIREKAFYGCLNLCELTIPDSVTEIESGAFECSSLISDEYGTIKYVDGWVVGSGHTANVVLKDGTRGIAFEAFSCDEIIEKVTMPDTVKYINAYAFENCTNLSEVLLSSSLENIENGAFLNCMKLADIVIPDSVISISSDAFYNTALLDKQNTPVKYVGKWVIAAEDCDKIVIKDGTKCIANNAFSSCTSLTDITIPDSVTMIGDYAFGNCNSLTEIKIPNNVKSIGRCVFWFCESLKKVTIPDSVTMIGDMAFVGCTSLTDITIPGSVTMIGDAAFNGCASLKDITIPGSVTMIGNAAFGGCTSLTDITISDGVTSIGDSAFYNCPKLINVTIPDSVTNIGDYAFGFDENDEKIDGFKIYCYGGTAGEQYAKDNGFEYKILECKVHKFGEWTITQEASCTKDGEKVRVCSLCNKTETETIPAEGHTEVVDKAVAATCTKTGLTEGIHCSVCNAVIKAQEVVPATGKHSFGDWKTTKAATCTATGTKTKTCSVCGKVETQTIKALGHKYSTTWTTDKAATCGAAGSKSHHCTRCGAKKDVTAIPATGKHDFNNWKTTKAATYTATGTKTKTCKVCKKTETATIAKLTLAKVGGFKVKAKDSTSITLQWNKNNSASGYIIEVYNGKTWSQVTKIAKNSTLTYKVTKLSASKTYQYRIKAYKTEGKATAYSANSATLSVNTNPTNMSGFKAKAKSYNSITLQWNKNTSATGYELQKWDGKKWVSLTKINKNSTTTYTVKSLKASTTYKYRIRAYKTIGKATQYSGYSATLSVNTNPTNMSGFKAKSKTATSITLQWNKNTSATGYELQKWDGKKWVTLTKINKNSTTTYTVKSLKASTTYKYRIRAYKTIGKATQYSAYTTTLSVNTNPTNMGGFKAKSKSYNSITLQWNKNASATGYELQKWDGKKWVSLTKIAKNSTTTYTVKGLKASTTYKYRIRAYKTIGKATQYSAYTATLSVNTNPSNMSGFKAKAKSYNSITLQWNKNTSATGYELQKWDGKKWVTLTKISKNSTTTYTVKSLKASTTYKYRIRAYKTIGKTTQYSAYTATLSVNTNPYNMSGFKAKSTAKTSVTLQWNKNTSATGYEIQKWNGKKWVSAAKVTKNSTVTSTVKSLKKNTSYKFRVRAYKTIGKATQYSSWSGTLTVKTKK